MVVRPIGYARSLQATEPWATQVRDQLQSLLRDLGFVPLLVPAPSAATSTDWVIQCVVRWLTAFVPEYAVRLQRNEPAHDHDGCQVIHLMPRLPKVTQ